MVLKGEIDGINVLDVVTMISIILQLENATKYIVWTNDLNFDNSIKAMDVIL